MIDTGLSVWQDPPVLRLHWHVGDVISKILMDRGRNQAWLAARADVRENTISDVRKGKPYKSDTLNKIAIALGTTATALHAAVPSDQPRHAGTVKAGGDHDGTHGGEGVTISDRRESDRLRTALVTLAGALSQIAAGRSVEEALRAAEGRPVQREGRRTVDR